MSLRSRFSGLFGRVSEEEVTKEIPRVEPQANSAESAADRKLDELQEHAQAIEIFRAVDAIIAKGIRAELERKRITPADKLAKNQAYNDALAAYDGLKNNPIREAVERYIQHKSDGSDKLMGLLSEDIRKYVAQQLKALQAGEPRTYLNVAQLYDALKKWSEVEIDNHPALDSATVGEAGEKVKHRLSPVNPRPRPVSTQV